MVITRGFAPIPLWWYAAGLVIVGFVLTAPVSRRLARANWPVRAPRGALVLWQAVCLAAGFSFVAGLVLLAVEPAGNTILVAAWSWLADLFSGTLELPVWRLTCGLIAALMTVALLAALARTALLTVRRRRAHRQILDLLTQPAPGILAGQPGGSGQDVRVLDHRAAIAYTLPGWHSRVVLSAGLIDLLLDHELAAVIEHERAHLRARHDLLVLPFQSWAAALGWVPGVRLAGGSVAELTEMLADDVAAARVSRGALAAALAKVVLSGSTAAPNPNARDAFEAASDRRAGPPDGTLNVPGRAETAEPSPIVRSVTAQPGATGSIGGMVVAARVKRLLDPHPLSGWQRASVTAVSLLLLAIPASVLLLTWT